MDKLVKALETNGATALPRHPRAFVNRGSRPISCAMPTKAERREGKMQHPKQRETNRSRPAKSPE